MRKFDRIVRATVGDRVLSSKTPGGQQGLHLSFRVGRSVDRSQDSTEVTVYGVSFATLSALQAPGAVSTLAAGYQMAPLTLAAGRVIPGTVGRVIPGTVDAALDGEQFVVTWRISQAGVALRAIDVARAWSGPVTSDEVIAYLLQYTGLSRGTIEPGRTVTYTTGIALCGSALDELEQIAADTGSRLAIDNGVLHLWPVGQQRQALRVVVSSSTGLVGIPERADQGRWQVRMLLEPSIRPGDQVRIDHPFFRGLLRAVDVEHAGDSGYQLDYYTTIVGVPV
jgi:hypothetical protein